MEKVERMLQCTLTDSELLTISEELGQKLSEQENLEAEKKAATSDFKYRADALDTVISRAGKCLREKVEERPVECVWHWHTPRRNRKSLWRTDTYEVVEEADMTDRDHQKAADANQTTIPFSEHEEVQDNADETESETLQLPETAGQ